jgi:hypothetical protein
MICLFFALDPDRSLSIGMYNFSYTLMMFNSIMNPIIYAWQLKDFRETFKELLTCRVCKTQVYLNQQVPVEILPPENNHNMSSKEVYDVGDVESRV